MTHRRLTFAVLSLAAAALWAAPALAHAELESSSIADGASVAMAPAELELTFSEPIALAGVTLTTAEGGDIAFDFTPAREEAATHTVALPMLEPAAYSFTWRALGEDGHVITGTIAFTVGGEHAGHPAGHMPAAEGEAGHDQH